MDSNRFPDELYATTPAPAGDDLLLRAWRLIAVGQGHCPLLDGDLVCACGHDAEHVLGCVYAFMCATALAGRRRLTIGYPGYPARTSDECRLLQLVEAAQTQCESLFEAHLCWLACHDLRTIVAQRTRTLANALDHCGLRLDTCH
ncbi:MAG TPA: hypothetical protein VF271_08300 [Rhodanobacteraceae bacterium]